MAYQRPTNRLPLSRSEKLNLLKDYVRHYRQLVAADSTVLNRKVPREAFGELLDRLGEMLLTESARRLLPKLHARTWLFDSLTLRCVTSKAGGWGCLCDGRARRARAHGEGRGRR